MSNRLALIIASYEYSDSSLSDLVAPPQDAEAFSEVLQDPDIGNFQVETLLNKSSTEVRREIERFFARGERDDLLLFYFTGHGIKDDEGRLFFAMPDTERDLLRATAVRATFVNEVMRRSRSRSQVVLLDCCFSGAFARGMVAKAANAVGSDIGAAEHLHGSGRVIITASDAMQYAFEGNHVEGAGSGSVFTSSLVEGLRTGMADLDGDGNITLDELYDYVRLKIRDTISNQRPKKWDFEVEGDIVVARNPKPVFVPAVLPEDLLNSVHDPRSWVRLGAVQHLGPMLESDIEEIALAARKQLGALVDDDSFRVRQAVLGYLDAPEKATDETLVDTLQISSPKPTPVFDRVRGSMLDLRKHRVALILLGAVLFVLLSAAALWGGREWTADVPDSDSEPDRSSAVLLPAAMPTGTPSPTVPATSTLSPTPRPSNTPLPSQIPEIEAETEILLADQLDTPTAIITDTPTAAVTNIPTAAITDTPTRTPIPTPQPWQLEVILSSVNLRSGPGMSYNTIGVLYSGDIAGIIARNRDGSWLNIELEDGRRGWIATSVTDQQPENIVDISIAATIPARPTATSTATPEVAQPPASQPLSGGGSTGSGSGGGDGGDEDPPPKPTAADPDPKPTAANP